MPDKTFYRIALTLIKGVGPVLGRQLLRVFGDEEAVFTENKRALESIPGIGPVLAAEIRRLDVLRAAEQECLFVEKNKISVYFISDPLYPYRLKECDDAPLLFYFKGSGRPEAPRVLSIVGTRRISEYGKELTRALLRDLSRMFPDLLVVSGLAYGVDVHAHRYALQYGLPTIGVLAHGLDRIYPAAHRRTAIDMLDRGGLLTDFPSGTNPDRPMFVARNRIVAALSDATVVVESAAKGGSLITADLAFSYSRDVFSFPGRVGDDRSCGCNQLIRQNKAGLITSAADLAEAMGWQATDPAPSSVEKESEPRLASALLPEEERILQLLRHRDIMQIDEMARTLDIPVFRLTPLLFGLEMKGVIRSLPGNRYQAALVAT